MKKEQKNGTVQCGDDITDELFFGFPRSSIYRAEERLQSETEKSVAYFSMEFGLAPSIYHEFQSGRAISDENKFTRHRVFSNLRAMDLYNMIQINKILDLPIYSGGLGVLAGDTLKSAADHNISLVGIGILWNKGYFKQNFWFASGQIPDELDWDPYTYPGLVQTEHTVTINIEKDTLALRVWKYYVYSYDQQSVVPLILLDSDIEENGDSHSHKRHLTDQLYRSDHAWWKVIQRTILGVGGIGALHALGYKINAYHMNEGHAALAFAEKAKHLSPEDQAQLRSHFAYTCHTPVEAGHDRFSLKDLEHVLDPDQMKLIKKEGMDPKQKNVVNLTILAMNSSNYVNAVAKKHGEVTRIQFPQYREKIATITNGVHTYTWLSEPIGKVLERYKDQIGDWQRNPMELANVKDLKGDMQFRRLLWEAHQQNKKECGNLLRQWLFNENVFTIAWARRIASYKRPSLILQDVDCLLDIARKKGPLQIIFAGKAHPNDNLGHTFINTMLERIDSLAEQRDIIKIFMLENYDTFFGKLLTSSVDVWLNNPLPPFEASGTSGMKAILNGVIQLSTLDGWVVEAKDANIGRIFGYVPPDGEVGHETNLRFEEDSQALYEALEDLVNLYYDSFGRGEPRLNSEWIDMMINCISTSGFFSTHRMVHEYNDMIWQRI